MELRTFQPTSIEAAGAVFRGLISPAQNTSHQEVIVAFHGYGRPPDDFTLFLPLLKPHQTLVSLGLFGHGTSELPQDFGPNQPIRDRDMKRWMNALIDAMGVETIHLLTYSMGGRIALKTAELLPDRVGTLLLNAPDGFRDPWMYRPLFGSMAGRAFYGFTARYPGWIFGLTRLARKLGLIHAKTEKFVEVHFGTREKRDALQRVWTPYRLIEPNLDTLAQYTRDQRITMHLVFGEFDSVIPPSLGQKFQEKTPVSVLHTLPAGHQLLTPELTALITERGLWF